MRLYIDVLTAKQFLCAFSCQFLNYIHALTSTVITLSRITFCIFVGQNTSHCRHNRRAHPVFRCDQLNVAVLSVKLCSDRCCNFRIYCLYIFQCIHNILLFNSFFPLYRILRCNATVPLPYKTNGSCHAAPCLDTELFLFCLCSSSFHQFVFAKMQFHDIP